MTYGDVKRTVEALVAEPPQLGPERLPSAAVDHARLAPAIHAEVAAYARSPEESARHDRELRDALLRIASIECASGSPPERCMRWFECIGALAAWTPPGAAEPLAPAEAAIWLALAGRFDDPAAGGWPDEPGTAATPDRAVFRLFTRKPVELASSDLHDDRLWVELADALERRDEAAAGRAFDAIASWWLEEYDAAGTPAYDPERFSSFEPAPNAALAIARRRDGLRIQPSGEERRRFYYVALMRPQEARS
jgi:hypothetical protein